MKSTIKYAILATTFILVGNQFAFAGGSDNGYPKPYFLGGCGDDPWPVEGFWERLQNGQWGAENLHKGAGAKVKIVQRQGNMIHALHCYKITDRRATTEFLDTHHSTDMGHFRLIQGNEAAMDACDGGLKCTHLAWEFDAK